MASAVIQRRDWIVIGSLLSMGVIAASLWHGQHGIPSFTILLFAYAQNIGFSLTSRARTRDSNLYHLIASVCSSVVWFFTFQILVRVQMDLAFFLPYTAGTVLGSITGSQVSAWIEKQIGAVADGDAKNTGKKVSVIPLLGLLATCSLVQMFFFPPTLGWPFFVLIASCFVRDFSFSMRTWVQNRNSEKLIIGVNVLTAVTEFFAWGGLFQTAMPWNIFLPYTTAGTAGSIFGANIAAWAGKKVGASADAHLKKGYNPTVFNPYPHIILGASIVGASIFWGGGFEFLFLLIVIGNSFAKSVAFTMVSRSRNRNHILYHLVSALGANGLWFFTLYSLALKNLDPHLAIPYIAASVSGGLAAVRIAMWVEKAIGASADAHVKQVKPA